MIRGKPQSFDTWLKQDAHSLRTWMENLNNGERFKQLKKKNKQINIPFDLNEITDEINDWLLKYLDDSDFPGKTLSVSEAICILLRLDPNSEKGIDVTRAVSDFSHGKEIDLQQASIEVRRAIVLAKHFKDQIIQETKEIAKNRSIKFDETLMTFWCLGAFIQDNPGCGKLPLEMSFPLGSFMNSEPQIALNANLKRLIFPYVDFIRECQDWVLKDATKDRLTPVGRPGRGNDTKARINCLIARRIIAKGYSSKDACYRAIEEAIRGKDIVSMYADIGREWFELIQRQSSPSLFHGTSQALEA